MRSLKRYLGFGSILFVLGLGMPAHADLLYEVDFGSPPHTVGQPPLTGAGPAPRATPTAINFGNPTVLATFGDMLDQPCAFGNGTTGYDQLQFSVAAGYPNGFPEDYDDYYLYLDIVIEDFQNDVFAVLFDAPSVNRLDFLDGGDIRVTGSSTVIGSWTAGTTVHVEIHFDCIDAMWQIWLDGYSAYSGPVSTNGELRTIRLHQSGTNAANGAAADDFILHGGLPGSGIETHGSGPAHAKGRVLPPHPNPATDRVTIRWTAPEPTSVLVEVFDVTGRWVWARRPIGNRAGERSIRWDGRDADGRRVSSGTYWVRVLAGDRNLGAEKIVLRR